MPRITVPYDPAVGPLLRVRISDPDSYRREEEAARSDFGMLLLDTGASDSSVRGALAARLGLPILGFHTVSGFGATAPTHQYLADLELWLDVPYPLDDWRLLRFESAYEQIDGILDRDVLTLGRFTLDGPARRFTLEF